jgi:hypothetical protein
MAKLLNDAELRRLARETDIRTSDGKKVTQETILRMAKKVVAEVEEKSTKIEAPPVVTLSAPVSPELITLVHQGQEQTRVIAEKMGMLAASVSAPRDSRKKRWRFIVERDPISGLIQEIVADEI